MPARFIEPTVFDNVDNKMKIAQEEIFGPVLSVIPVKDAEQALTVANDTIYGLASAIFTADINKAFKFAKAPARRLGVGQHLRRRRHHHAVRRLQAVGQRPRQVAPRLRQVHPDEDDLDPARLSYLHLVHRQGGLWAAALFRLRYRLGPKHALEEGQERSCRH